MPVFMTTGEAAQRRFKDGASCSLEPIPTGTRPEPFDSFTGHRRGADFHPARRGEITVKPDKHEPETGPALSVATINIALGLFLTVFTIGTALLIWRSLSAVSEGGHWMDQFLGAIRAISALSAVLFVLYGIFVAKAYGNWAKDQFRLCYEQGLAEGRQRAAEPFGMDACNGWMDWTEWKKLTEAALREGRPRPEPPSWSLN